MIEVDWSLTVENCGSRQYEWVTDTYFHVDDETPQLIKDKLIEDMQAWIEKGYLLGEPANRNAIENGLVGFYKPMDK